MEKTIWIKKQGGQYAMTTANAGEVGRLLHATNWEGMKNRLAVLGFSAASIQATEQKFEAGETVVMLTIV
jgi:hypothetical protein